MAYYVPYVATQPVVYLCYPPTTPSPSWSIYSLPSSASHSSPQMPPTPTLPPVPLPTFCCVYHVEYAARPRSPPPKPKHKGSPPAAVSAALTHRPHVDPLIAPTAPHFASIFCSGWDLWRDPRTLRIADDYLRTVSWADLAARPAVRAAPQDGGRPLRSLILIFRYLPVPLQITITPSPSSLKSALPDGGDYVSIWDVLAGLYDGLRAPVDPTLYNGMASRHQDILHGSTARRMAGLGEGPAHVVRNVDFLRRRRMFVGIRVAEPNEVPKGRLLGEVFVVEVQVAGSG